MIQILRQRFIRFLFGLVPLLALVWWAGPRLGLPSVAARLGWVLLLLTLWGGLQLTGPLLRERAGPLARSLAPGSVPGPTAADRPGLTALRRGLGAAVATLKASHLGRTRGRAALYHLPWFMLIGRAGAGKSALVRASGLTFTLPAGSGPDPLPPMAAGTAGCDWSFATEAVLLDTAGSLVDRPEARPEWLELLRLLRRHRSKGPLEGILLALSLGELVGPDPRELSDHLRRVRQRLSDAARILGARIPVYLVITHMDRLHGFDAFFRELDQRQSGQVWGATFAEDPGPDRPAAGIVDGPFQGLCAGLEQMAVGQLTRNPGAGSTAVTFPLEFRALREALAAGVAPLVEADPYHSRPMLRGFYFTSAGPGPTPPEPLHPALDRVARDFGLAPDAILAGPTRTTLAEPTPTTLAGPAGAVPARFMEDLFRRVLVPDRSLVRRRSGLPPGPRLAAMAAGLAGLALLAGGWTCSYLGNRTLVRTTRAALAEAQDLEGRATLADRLRALQVLQGRLDLLRRHRRGGRPLTLGWGLYQGRRLERTLWARYRNGLARTLLDPVKEVLETRLAGFPAGKGERTEAEQAYTALKTYLMLAHPERMDPIHLAEQLPRCWQPWLRAQDPGPGPQRDGIEALAEGTVAFYLARVREPDLPVIDNRPDLVAQVRARLAGTVRHRSPLDQVYDDLKSRADAAFEPVTAERLLNGRDLDLVTGAAAVPGSFTRAAWDGWFRPRFLEAAHGRIQGTDWVLDAPLSAPQPGQDRPETRQAELLARYKADYAQAWIRFFQGLTVGEAAAPGQAAAALARLADPQASPLKAILAKAGHETGWDNRSELEQSLRSARDLVVERTGKLLGTAGAPGASPGEPRGPLGERFRTLAALAGPGGGAPAAIDGYLDLLRKIRLRLLALGRGLDPGDSARQWLQATLAGGSELTDGLQWLDGCVPAGGDPAGLRPFLLQPLLRAYAAALPGAEQSLNRAWAEQVYGPWRALADKYPFVDAAQDAPMADLARFLKPGEGTLARFIDGQLGSLVALRGERYAPRAWYGLGIGFGPGFLNGISRLHAAAAALADGESARFELQPVPNPGLSEVLLEIDGQRLHYRNGPQTWAGFSWPAPVGPSGARIQAVTLLGLTAELQDAPGRLGLMRLLDRATVENRDAPATSLEWPGPTRPVRFNFRLVSGPNPLRLANLRHQALPARTTR